MRTIGQNIKECIEYVGLSQGQLAKITGLTPAAISQYVNNLRQPSIESLKLIARACDTSVEYLIREEDNLENPNGLCLKYLSEEDALEVKKFFQFLNFKKKDRNNEN